MTEAVNSADRGGFDRPFRCARTTAADFSVINEARTNRADDRPNGPCGCPVPLILDRETGEWLHLATMSRCPQRLDST